MIGFIDDHRGAYGVEPICKVLPIAPSTYRAHASRRGDPAKLSVRARRDTALLPEIQRIFDENFQIPTGVLNTSAFDTPSALLRLASSPLSAASATATTIYGRLPRQDDF